MGRLPLRRALIAATACAALVASPARSQPVAPPAPLVVDADPAHPVFAGRLEVRVVRPADRIELLLGVPPQQSAEANQAATAALLELAHAALPGVPATSQPTTALRERLMPLTNPAYGGYVRLDLPPRAGDAVLRAAVTRVAEAINQRADGAAAGARIVSVAHGYASCAPFAQLGGVAVAERIEAYARALGAPEGTPQLVDRTRTFHVIDGPPYAEPLCGPDAHVTRETALELPSSASFEMPRSYGFAQRMRSFAPRANGAGDAVPVLWAGPSTTERVRIRARTAVITLEGHTLVKSRLPRMLYEYTGPHARYFPRDVTEAHLVEIRRRLRAAGVPDRDIVTQLAPAGGRWYVVAFTNDAAPDDRIVTALAGTSDAERHAVRAARFGGDCLGDPDALQRAAADAVARARRIGALLGGTVDTAHPIAVAFMHGAAVNDCPYGSRLPALPNPIARHVAGTLLTPRPAERESSDLFVSATFPLSVPALAGAADSPPASDPEMSYAARFGFAPPPVDYPEASATGEARRERRLPPDRIRIETTLLSDHAHGFHAIDPSFARTLASRLGARDADYTAAFVPSEANLPTGEPEPDSLEFVAVLPYRGEETLRAANAALRATNDVGYGGFNVVPQRDDCTAAADLLARDAIRAAAAQAHASSRARLVAIDLRGPFTAEGTCRPGPGGAQNWSVREVTVPDVRLAAYARVSYAAR
jgi:hypothetical protein